jgi:hypothetical protein
VIVARFFFGQVREATYEVASIRESAWHALGRDRLIRV